MPLRSEVEGTMSRFAIPVRGGELDGVTLMRYAHIFRARHTGGAEQYLERLNRELLERHEMTIIQVYLVEDRDSANVDITKHGRGFLVSVPVYACSVGRSTAGYVSHLQTIRRHAGAGVFGVLKMLYTLTAHRGKHLRYRFAVFSEHLSALLLERKVDLLAIHWLSYDVDFLLRTAMRLHVPFVLINHFDNARLLRPEYKRWSKKAAAIGGVSSAGAPPEFHGKLCNLSDAIDTMFFDPTAARRKALDSVGPATLLLPARVIAGKGHMDLLRAAHLLKQRGFSLKVVFAGVVHSEELQQTLTMYAQRVGLINELEFVGEIGREELRDLYATSQVVALPTSYEGLGRVLLEAQAMETPVVAYDSGGTRDAVRDGETGFLVRCGDIAALAERISVLLTDGARATLMGLAGRAFVRAKFSVDPWVERHEQFYLRAMGRSTFARCSRDTNSLAVRSAASPTMH